MAYAITQNCCTDATCISVCPVNCIHPTPEEPDFGHTDLLYIDPAACIDCGACADACPVDAIFPVDRLAGSLARYGEVNRQYYQDNPNTHAWGKPEFPRSVPADLGTLRVAVVGTGPAAAYTAQELLRTAGAEVTMIDRQPMAGGLLRHGVAPDHQATKRIGDSFAQLYRNPRLRLHLNVEIGRDLSAADLAAHHHAVVYAVGATADRRLDVPGEELPRVLGAGTVVGWYNADPDVPAVAVDLSAERAVVVGNGNVALDIARVLLSDPERLAGTDIADHALAALRGSSVREVVLLARRGPADAAYTAPEFLALRQLPGIAVVVASDEALPEVAEGKSALLDGLPVEAVDWTRPPPAGRRIVLRFLERPAEFFGRDRVEGAVGVRRAGPRRAGGAGDRLPRRAAARTALRRGHRDGAQPQRAGGARELCRGLGQARPDRRDRCQPRMRPGDGGRAARRRGRRAAPAATRQRGRLRPPGPPPLPRGHRSARAAGDRPAGARARCGRRRPRVKLATAAELLSVRGR